MDSQKPKIAMYAKRSFGDKLNATFDFIKENWKPLLKLTTYLILPLCLVQALSLNYIMGGASDMTNLSNTANVFEAFYAMGSMFFLQYIAYMFLYLIGTVLLTSLIYALMQAYNEREERLEGITLGVLKPLLFRNIKRLFLAMIAGFVLMMVVLIIVGFMAGALPFTLILTIPFLIAFSVRLALFIPTYLFENITLIDAFKKTLRLGYATWGGIFLILIVMGLISGVLQGVTMMPWYIATMVKVLFAMSDTESVATVSVGYSFILYLLGIIQVFGIYLSMIFTHIGLAYQYGHASEVVDSVMVENDIDNFDKL